MRGRKRKFKGRGRYSNRAYKKKGRKNRKSNTYTVARGGIRL